MNKVDVDRMKEVLGYLWKELDGSSQINLILAGLLISQDFDNPHQVINKIATLNKTSQELNLSPDAVIVMCKNFYWNDLTTHDDQGDIQKKSIQKSDASKLTENFHRNAFVTPKPINNAISIESVDGETDHKDNSGSKEEASTPTQTKKKLITDYSSQNIESSAPADKVESKPTEEQKCSKMQSSVELESQHDSISESDEEIQIITEKSDMIENKGSCEHSYKRSELKEYLIDKINNKTFPFKCIVKDCKSSLSELAAMETLDNESQINEYYKLLFMKKLSHSKKALVWCADCAKLSVQASPMSKTSTPASNKKSGKTTPHSHERLKCDFCGLSKSVTYVKTVIEQYKNGSRLFNNCKQNWDKKHLNNAENVPKTKKPCEKVLLDDIDDVLNSTLIKCKEWPLWKTDIKGADNFKCACDSNKPKSLKRKMPFTDSN